jgi:tRNA(fMet)-specific endonuclease VapC
MTAAPAYLLATNTASFIIRGGPPHLLIWLQVQSVSTIGISAITEAELRYGLARKPGATTLAAAVAAFLRHVQAMPWDSEAAVSYGALRAARCARGGGHPARWYGHTDRRTCVGDRRNARDE